MAPLSKRGDRRQRDGRRVWFWAHRMDAREIDDGRDFEIRREVHRETVRRASSGGQRDEARSIHPRNEPLPRTLFLALASSTAVALAIEQVCSEARVQ